MKYRVKSAGVLAAALMLATSAWAQPPAAPPLPTPSPGTPQLTAEQIQALMDPAVEEHLRAVTAAIPGARTMKVMRGRMGPGEKQKFNVQADAGEFYIAAVCDNACSDINLSMMAPGGTAGAVDDKPNKFPITRANVTGRASFDVEVTMQACASAACAWGLTILNKIDAPAATPTAAPAPARPR